MPINLQAKDLMIPVDNYATTTVDEHLREAVRELSKIYYETDAEKGTGTRHRTCLVLDAQGKLVGILDFKSILKALIPGLAGGLKGDLHTLGTSVAFAEADSGVMDPAKHEFGYVVRQKALTRVGDVMLKIRGCIDADASFLDALKMIYKNKITVLPVYEGGELVGVLRDADLFLIAAKTLLQ